MRQRKWCAEMWRRFWKCLCPAACAKQWRQPSLQAMTGMRWDMAKVQRTPNPCATYRTKRRRESENQRMREREKDGKRQTDKETKREKREGREKERQRREREEWPAFRFSTQSFSLSLSLSQDSVPRSAHHGVRRGEAPLKLSVPKSCCLNTYSLRLPC